MYLSKIANKLQFYILGKTWKFWKEVIALVQKYTAENAKFLGILTYSVLHRMWHSINKHLERSEMNTCWDNWDLAFFIEFLNSVKLANVSSKFSRSLLFDNLKKKTNSKIFKKYKSFLKLLYENLYFEIFWIDFESF